MTRDIGPQYGMPVASSPAKIAEQVESAGVAKAAMPVGKLSMVNASAKVPYLPVQKCTTWHDADRGVGGFVALVYWMIFVRREER